MGEKGRMAKTGRQLHRPSGARGLQWQLVAGVAALVVGLLPLPGHANGCKPDLAVTLDIGHSPGRSGATSARGKPEYRFNRRFAEELKGIFARRPGVSASVINAGGADISLSQRAELVRAVAAGVLLSIHHDSVQPQYLSHWTVGGKEHAYSDVFHGYSLFVSNRSSAYGDSVALARAIGRALQAAGFHASLHHAEAIAGENRPVIDATNGVFRHDGLAVLKNAKVPAVLIEVGIILNRDEEAALESADYRARFQNAIVAAVAAYCGGGS